MGIFPRKAVHTCKIINKILQNTNLQKLRRPLQNTVQENGLGIMLIVFAFRCVMLQVRQVCARFANLYKLLGACRLIHRNYCQATCTPCPEKNGTNNVLSITLTKFNKFSHFLAQFMLTYQLTKKL